MSVLQLFDACMLGDESKAKSLLARDPGLHNKQDILGNTGLVAALQNKRHSLCRCLLSLPGLDTNLRDKYNYAALHHGCLSYAPLDILITLVRLSSWETVNMKNGYGKTALD